MDDGSWHGFAKPIKAQPPIPQDPFVAWEKLVDKLGVVGRTLSPLESYYMGSASSACEHARKALLAGIAEELRLESAGIGQKPTEAQLGNMAHCDERYLNTLNENADGLAEMLRLKKEENILIHRIALARARAFKDTQHHGP